MADKIREGNKLYQDGNYDGALDKYVNAQIDSRKYRNWILTLPTFSTKGANIAKLLNYLKR